MEQHSIMGGNMSNHKLWTVANYTDEDLKFVNLECAADGLTLPKGTVTNTPGQKGKGCDIPDCSESKWWSGHRMTFTSASYHFNLWKDDNTIYFSEGDGYPQPLPTGVHIDNNVELSIYPASDEIEGTDEGGKNWSAGKIITKSVKAVVKVVAAVV